MPRVVKDSRKAKKAKPRTAKTKLPSRVAPSGIAQGDGLTTGLLELWQEFGMIKGAFRDDHYVISMTAAQTPDAQNSIVTPPFQTWLFVAWLDENGLSQRSWSDDDLWYLASEDFAPANGYELPPREAFLADVARLHAASHDSYKLAA